jgi:hypothetical protein
VLSKYVLSKAVAADVAAAVPCRMKFEWVKLRYLQQNLGLTPWYK